MKIVIVGPGSIGCLFACFFAGTKHDVWLLDKDPARADAIAKNGIRIEDSNGSRTIKVNITADVKSLTAADLLYICVKSYDTLPAIRAALPLVKPGTIVISLQNGAGNAEHISSIVNAERIVCGITSHGVTMLETGHILHAGSGPTSVASFLPQQAELAVFSAKIMAEAGIKTQMLSDAQSMIWSKLIINASINPLTVISNVTNGQILLNKDLRSTMHKAALEAASVAEARGTSLVYDNVINAVEDVCHATKDNVSSMLQDFRYGRKTEIDSINGVIIKEAKIHGIPSPINEMLFQKVKKLTEHKT